jgi:hypothetical protein
MVYIGTAFNVEDRWRNHGAGYRGQSVYKFIQEYGWNNIEHEVLLFLPHSKENPYRSTEQIRKMERELIHAYGDRCYNRQCASEFHEEVAETNRKNGAYDPKVYWTINGESRPAKDICADLGLNYGKIAHRISKYELTPEQAVNLPPVPRKCTRSAVSYWESQGYYYFDEYKNGCRA